MSDTITAVKDVERDLIINIILSIKYGRTDLMEAKRIAKEFMDSYPYENKRDLYAKIDYLSDKYRLVRKVYVKYVPVYENEKTEKIINSMRKHIKENDFISAIKVAKDDQFLRGFDRKERHG